MKVSTRKSNKDDQPLLSYELHDDTDKNEVWAKLKIIFLVIASFALGICVVHLWQKKDVPQLSSVAEQQVGEATTVQKNIMHDTNEIDPLKLEWKELEIVFEDPTSDLSKYLEDDVFQRLDLDGDGKLSVEERKRFLQSSVLQSFADFDEQKMEKVRNNLPYPVLKITSDMDDQQINKICDMANWLKDTDLGELFDKMFGKNPELLIENGLEVVDEFIKNDDQQKNIDFGEFHSFLDKAEHEIAFSPEFQMPEECNQIAIPSRRRAFGGIIAAIGVGVYFSLIPFVAGGAVVGNQIDCWIPNGNGNGSGSGWGVMCSGGCDKICRGPGCRFMAKRRIRRNLIESSTTANALTRRRRLEDCDKGAAGRIFSEVAGTMVGQVSSDGNEQRKEALSDSIHN